MSKIVVRSVEEIISFAELDEILASSLGVTMDYLAGRTDSVEAIDIIQADPQVKDLITAYGGLSAKWREHLIVFGKFLTTLQNEGS